jgi:(p)ppGpp synthase/HD superfamily hydrolase
MSKRATLQGEKMYKLAYELAKAAHRGDFRKDGKTPYFEHVKEVASRVSGWDVKTVAILHDTIEDTVITAEDLRSVGFPKRIVDAVKALTKPKDCRDYIGEIRRKVRPNKLATLVKISDNYANMRDRVSEWPKSAKARRKLHEYASSIALLTKPKGKKKAKE